MPTGSRPAGRSPLRRTVPLTRWRQEAFRGGQPVAAPTNSGEVARLLEDPTAFVWLDIPSPGEADVAWLQETLGMHPLAVEDSGHPTNAGGSRPMARVPTDSWSCTQ